MNDHSLRKSIYSTESTALRTFLKERREELGLSMREFSEEVDLHHSIIGKIETGDRRLDVVEFIQYCKALEVEPQKVIELVIKSTNNNK